MHWRDAAFHFTSPSPFVFSLVFINLASKLVWCYHHWRRAFRLKTFWRNYSKTFQCAVLGHMGIDSFHPNSLFFVCHVQIRYIHGPLPDKPVDVQENSSFGPAWLWYCLNMLPLSEEKKLLALSSTSLRTRLEMLRACLKAYTNSRAVCAFLAYQHMRGWEWRSRLLPTHARTHTRTRTHTHTHTHTCMDTSASTHYVFAKKNNHRMSK